VQFLAEGETITFSYTVTVTDDSGTGTNSASEVVTVTITGSNEAPELRLGGGEYVLDQFSSQNYNLNSGTVSWATPWMEIGDNFNAPNGSPTAGEFQIAVDQGGFKLQLSDRDAESAPPDLIQRTVNLSTATSATLTFDYRRDIPNADAGDLFIVSVSSNGTDFTHIGQIGATADGSFVDAAYQQFTFELPSSLISANTTIRFSVGDDVDDGDIVYVDNVKVAYSTAATSEDLAVTYTENGAAVPVSLFTRIADPDNTHMASATIVLTNKQAGDFFAIGGTAVSNGSAGSIGQNVRDEFGATLYGNNNGSMNWVGNWAESSDDNSAIGGDIRIVGGELRLGNGSSATIERAANLAGATSAMLSFDVREVGLGADENVFIYISSNGTDFVLLDTIDQGTNTTSFSHDITAYISSTTTVRIEVESGLDSGEFVYIDNVDIAFTTMAYEVTEDGDSITVELSGPATAAAYQAAIDSITFANATENPSTVVSRTVDITVNDGNASSNTATTTINVVAVNDAPAVSGLVVTESSISFVASDIDNPALSLASPFAGVFGNPTITSGAATNLTPATQVGSAVSGTLQVTDNGVGGTANVIGLYLGTSGNNTGVAAPIAGSPNAMYGFGGNDSMMGGTAGDSLFGGAGNDKILGGAGADVLVGGADNDTLVGGSGSDNVTGGDGTDQFRMQTDGGTDLIADYADGTDKIGFLDTGSTSGGSVNFNTVGSATGAALVASDFASRTSITNIQNGDDEAVIVISTAQTTLQITGDVVGGIGSPNNNYVIVFNSSTGHGEVWYDTNWENPANRVQIATLHNITALGGVAAITAADIVVYNSASDPIIFDLGAPGLAFSGLADGVTFDINADGVADQMAWTAHEDGILALDLDGSGTIDNGTEIFSPWFGGGSYASSLAALATLDSNGDGLIDNGDAGFSSLKVWQDLDHDGTSDAGELTSLADLGITGINLEATPVDGDIDGQQVLGEGTFHYVDGTSSMFAEVALVTAFGTVAEPSTDASGDGDPGGSAVAGGEGEDMTGQGGQMSLVSTELSGGGDGNDTLTGEAGADTFNFAPGFGHDTIAGFTPGEDKIEFDPTIFATVDDILAHAQQMGNDIVIASDDAANSVTVTNVTTLSASDFVIH
jgi:hypothetical protein